MENASSEKFWLTDLGNAQRLASRFGKDIRYSYERRKWYVWDGRRWSEDNSGEIYRLGKRTIERLAVKASQVQDPGWQRTLYRCNGYIVKPFSFVDLGTKIRELLATSSEQLGLN
jgi:hypothetical protein